MLRLFVCKNCNHIFPDSSEDTICPKCGNRAIPTEYSMIDLAQNNAELTREIYRQYGIEYEEFTDMMVRVDSQNRKQKTLTARLRRIVSKIGNAIKKFFGKIKSLFRK